MNQSVELNIDELVLHGFTHADRLPIGLAIERELTLLFSKQGIPHELQKNSNQPSLDGGSFQMASNSSSGAIGNQIAGAVYSGFTSDKAL